MAKRFGVDTRVTRQLLQLGVMCATKMQRFDEGELIIRAVKAFRADVPHPSTALGAVYLYRNQLQPAAAELEQVLASYPNHQLGRALLGLVYREAGRREWRGLLQEVLEDGRDEWAIRLARETLGVTTSPPTAPHEHSERAESAPLRAPSPSVYA